MRRKMVLWSACFALAMTASGLVASARNSQASASRSAKPQAVKYGKGKIKIDGQKIIVAGKEVKAITFTDGTAWQLDKDGALNGNITIDKKAKITVGQKVAHELILPNNAGLKLNEECSCWGGPLPPPPPPPEGLRRPGGIKIK